MKHNQRRTSSKTQLEKDLQQNTTKEQKHYARKRNDNKITRSKTNRDDEVNRDNKRRTKTGRFTITSQPQETLSKTRNQT